MRESRPELVAALDATEFMRWYWTTAELRTFAGTLGVARRGPKVELSERIRATLAGEVVAHRQQPRRVRLSPPFSRDTPMSDGVVLSRALRDWFIGEVGPTFRANAALRRFLANGSGHTLGEALACYLGTDPLSAPPIGSQFEYNAFVRSWWARHPGGTVDDLRSAWAVWRATPVDERRDP